MKPKAVEQSDFAWLSRVALFGLLTVVSARCAMTEILREPDVVPGSAGAPRMAGPATTVVLNLLCCLPAMLVLARRWLDEKYVLRWNWSFAPMAALALWTTVSPFWSVDEFPAVVNSTTFLAAMVVLWSACQLVRSWFALRQVAGVVLGLLLIFVAQGANKHFVDQPAQVRSWNDPKSPNSRWEFMKEHNLEETDFEFVQMEKKLTGGELRGFSASSNTYAAMMVMMLMVGAGALVQRWKSDHSAAWLMPMALLAAGTAFILFFTFSRTALLTPLLGAGLLVIVMLSGGVVARYASKLYWAGVVGFFLAVAAVVGHGLYHNSLVDRSLTFRWYYWTGAARMVAQRPLTGAAYSNFGQYYTAVRPELATEEVQDPHNFIVRFFAETGLVGGALVIAWMLRLWWELTRPVRLADETDADTPACRRAFVGIAMIAVIAGVINFFAATDLDAESAWVLLQFFAAAGGVLLMLIGLGLVVVGSLREEKLDGRPASLLLWAMVIGTGLFLMHNLIDFSLFETGGMFLFALVCGAALGGRGDTEHARQAPRPRGLIILGSAGAAFVAYCVIIAIPVIRSEAAAAEGEAALRLSAPPGQPDRVSGQKLREAHSAYERAAETVPWNADYALRSAEVLIRQGAPIDKVRAALERAIALNPRSLKANLLAARFEIRQAVPDTGRVRSAWNAALALDPYNTNARIEYAEALDQLKDKPAALEQYRKTIQLDDRLPKDEPKRLPPKVRQQILAKLKAPAATSPSSPRK